MVGEKLGNSDHNITRFSVNIPQVMEKKMHQKLNFHLANYSRLSSLVENIVYFENGAIDFVWESFTAEYVEKREACILYKNILVTGNPQPKWFNRVIASKIGERNKAHKFTVQQPSLENETKHKKLCKEVDRLVRKAKYDDKHRIAKVSKENPKKIFVYANSRKPIKNKIGSLRDENGILVTTDKEKTTYLTLSRPSDVI